MKLYLIKIFIAAFPLLFLADNPWKIKSSAVTFRIKNAGINVNGAFSGLEAEIRFNPLKPEEASIKASVSSLSIDTDNTMRDDHLRKQEYFDAEKFPKISLQSTRIEKTGPITYNGYFRLTMKGVSKEVMIPFNFMRLPEKNELKGSFSLNRRDFGVGGNSISLADNVGITIVLNLTE